MEFEFLGPYKIEGTLGRGGMGTVYKGTHTKSNEPVAIKVIASVLADQERFRRRFAAEVETLKRLKHPNIVQLIGYGEEQGHLFYSMEYVPGRSLHDHLRQAKRLPWKHVIDICIDVCAALKQAHDLGIIHRDLKPANIMVTDQGLIKLTDFGIAKLFGSTDVTAAGAVIGTADFMPPEQAEGKSVTSRSDLYAVGSLAYACLTGRAPFTGKSVPEVLYSVRYNMPPPVQSLAPDVPDEFVELVDELLKKDPNARPPTALVVSNRLKALRLGLQRREEQSASSKILDQAANAVELTSIDLDALRESDSQLDNIKTNPFDASPDDSTKVVQHDAFQDRHPTSVRPTRPPVAGPNDSTRLATPSALESDFEEGEVADRVAGQTHFTIVEDDDRRKATHLEVQSETHSDWLHWLSVAGLVAMLIGCIFSLWYFTRPSSAQSLHQQIQTAIESGDDSQLIEAGALIEELETRFPEDPGLADYQSIKLDIDLNRTTKALMRRGRMEGGASSLDPLEQAFLDCIQARTQNESIAATKVDALITVFRDRSRLEPRQQKLLALAEHIRDQIGKSPVERTHPAAEQLQDQMRWAAVELPRELKPKFYLSIIELYQDKAWAKDVVANAKIALEALK